jgi:energy-coupling factor transporter ATP-binding protein EcfA2
MKFLVPEPEDFVKSKKAAVHEAFSAEKAPTAKNGSASDEDQIHKSPDRIPMPPKSVEETGIEQIFLRDLLLKTVFRTNVELPTRLAKIMCLLPTVLQEIIELARDQKYIETVGKTVGADSNELRYQLTDAGRKRAVDAFTQSEYYGAVPVPLDDFIAQAAKQKVVDISIPRQALINAMRNMIIHQSMLDEIGPAVNSGKSILLYGPPGNGKSSLANAIRDAIGERIYVPRFLEVNGQVIAMFDPVVHRDAETNTNDSTSLRRTGDDFDNRYILCKRPCVITGGELTLDMLDLKYSEDARIYQAPLQLKATGGVFIVDDLGRQQDPPQAMINRWITPMETGEDILGLVTGEKLAVPFDCMTVFSTNFHPNKLFDKAALRRIAHKILVEGPNRDQMLQIYLGYSKAVNLTFPEDVAIYLFTEKYPSVDNEYAAFHAKFLIDQMFSIAEYESRTPEITIPLIERAWANLYVEEVDFDN